MANGKAKAGKKARSENLWGYIMVAPTIIGLLVLNIYPFLDTIKLSFSKTRPFGLYELRGIENYVEMFTSAEFWRANLNTIWFCVLTVPLGIFLALIVAVMLNTKIKGRTAFRAIFFLPMVVAPAAVAMVWKWMFNTEYGIINTLLGHSVNWITDPNIVMITCAIVAIWSSIGYDAVLLLSGLQNISKSYYEAASLDGASKIQQFFYITLPMVSPTLFVVLINLHDDRGIQPGDHQRPVVNVSVLPGILYFRKPGPRLLRRDLDGGFDRTGYGRSVLGTEKMG